MRTRTYHIATIRAWASVHRPAYALTVKTCFLPGSGDCGREWGFVPLPPGCGRRWSSFQKRVYRHYPEHLRLAQVTVLWTYVGTHCGGAYPGHWTPLQSVAISGVVFAVLSKVRARYRRG